MTTRSPHIAGARRQTRARRLGLGLAALVATALLAASTPVPVLGSDTAGACPVGSSGCGG